MSEFTIRTSGNPLPWLRRIQGELADPSGSRIAKSMGKAAGRTVRDHFRLMSSRRHRGSAPGDFYGDAAAATNEEVDAAGNIAVVVGQLRAGVPGSSIALHYYGGTVRPRRSKYLTIPVVPEALGRRVGEFGDAVEFIINRRTGKGVATLAGRVIYALTKEARFEPDETVLPDAAALAASMAEAANQTIERMRRS